MVPLWLDDDRLVLTEAAVVERIRRDPAAPALHARLANAPLVLTEAGRRALRTIQGEYLDVAEAAGLPMVLFAPTWRASHERIAEDPAVPASLNRDAVAFTRGWVGERDPAVPRLAIGGLLGCRGDAYRPEDGLDAEAAERFHAWQAGELAEAGVDVLLGATIPSLPEAIGLARAMSATGVPSMVSFVIGRDGRVLDGTPLAEAIARVDDAVTERPLLGYGVNCAHPTFVDRRARLDRLHVIQANASALDHADLDGAPELRADDVRTWARATLTLRRVADVRVMGGCCGTDRRHLEALVEGAVNAARPGSPP